MPSACSARAMAAPRRLAAPVTSAVRPASFRLSSFISASPPVRVRSLKQKSMSPISQSLEDLPPPPPDALAHSKRVRALIQADIQRAGGRVPFARYMELALYAPGLGYYSAGARKFGAAGDFVTAPELSPLFSRCLARQCAEVLEGLGGGVLELGAGSGVMAADLLLALAEQRCLPDEYLILEVSADLKARQRETLAARAPGLLSRVR